jgi:hypothetical protein
MFSGLSHLVSCWAARSESSKGVQSLQILHALRKASGRATLKSVITSQLFQSQVMLFSLTRERPVIVGTRLLTPVKHLSSDIYYISR